MEEEIVCNRWKLRLIMFHDLMVDDQPLHGSRDLYFRTTIRKGRLVRKVEAHCPFIDDVNRLMQKEKVCQAVSVSSSMEKVKRWPTLNQ